MENFDRENIDKLLEIHQICQYFPRQNFSPYSTFQRLMIPIFGHGNLSIHSYMTLLIYILIRMHHTVEALSVLNQHNLMFYTPLIGASYLLSFVSITLKITLTFT